MAARPVLQAVADAGNLCSCSPTMHPHQPHPLTKAQDVQFLHDMLQLDHHPYQPPAQRGATLVPHNTIGFVAQRGGLTLQGEEGSAGSGPSGTICHCCAMHVQPASVLGQTCSSTRARARMRSCVQCEWPAIVAAAAAASRCCRSCCNSRKPPAWLLCPAAVVGRGQAQMVWMLQITLRPPVQPPPPAPTPGRPR